MNLHYSSNMLKRKAITILQSNNKIKKEFQFWKLLFNNNVGANHWMLNVLDCVSDRDVIIGLQNLSKTNTIWDMLHKDYKYILKSMYTSKQSRDIQKNKKLKLINIKYTNDVKLNNNIEKIQTYKKIKIFPSYLKELHITHFSYLDELKDLPQTCTKLSCDNIYIDTDMYIMSQITNLTTQYYYHQLEQIFPNVTTLNCYQYKYFESLKIKHLTIKEENFDDIKGDFDSLSMVNIPSSNSTFTTKSLEITLSDLVITYLDFTPHNINVCNTVEILIITAINHDIDFTNLDMLYLKTLKLKGLRFKGDLPNTIEILSLDCCWKLNETNHNFDNITEFPKSVKDLTCQIHSNIILHEGLEKLTILNINKPYFKDLGQIPSTLKIIIWQNLYFTKGNNFNFDWYINRSELQHMLIIYYNLRDETQSILSTKEKEIQKKLKEIKHYESRLQCNIQSIYKYENDMKKLKLTF
jgi:hypothetical protein